MTGSVESAAVSVVPASAHRDYVRGRTKSSHAGVTYVTGRIAIASPTGRQAGAASLPSTG